MRIKFFALALILFLFSGLLLTTPAQAADMSPSEGVVGTTVTVTDLSVGDSYTIKWDDTTYKTGVVPSSGAVTFTVPDASGGDHDIAVENPTDTTVLSGISFTVFPSIDIEPNSGTVGTSVAITGTGFGAAENNIKITYGSKTVKSGITADDNGTWDTTFTAPDSATGSHVVDASGSTTETGDVSDRSFTISPEISIAPTSGCVGTSVTVTGTGFASGEAGIKVTYSGLTVRTGVIADTDGAWETTFAVPDSMEQPG